jgi:hypothetical protein
VPRPKGLPKTGGRQKGAANKRTREIADRAAMEGITPLEVQLRTMRMLWAKAHEGSFLDLELAKQACAVAAQVAPYCHPRLAAVEARVGVSGQVEVSITEEERRKRAREEIAKAFPEWRPKEPEAERVGGRSIEQRSVIEDGDHGAGEAKTERLELPLPREFTREGQLEAAPDVTRLPTRYRPPRRLTNWSG